MPRSPRSTRPASTPEADEDEPFLRARRRVPVRRGLLPAWTKSRWGKGIFAALVLAVAGSLIAATVAVRSFLRHDPRFFIPSAASIQFTGNNQLTRSELLPVFGSDIGRNLFLVPLAERRQQLEQIPWVERASVMRVLPNQIRAAVVERTPVAFVLVYGHIELADAAGVLLEMTPQQMSAKRYSFPVVSGISPEDPPSVRAARMHLYQSFLADLDSSGEHISARLSQVDLSDPEDVRATVPLDGSEVLLYFGQQDFLARWHNFQTHVAEWQQQYPHLASIDLRYEREVVLQMSPSAAANGGTAPASNSPDAHPAPTATRHPPAAHRPPLAHHPAPLRHRHAIHPAPRKRATPRVAARGAA
ncbi:MAG TPA: FtsQ-type POTRA domain-containing protein [Acidobacteriaceae bacterium]|jgi:cell division protein FtsQ|nr:FtsQ-type POTRA domain-containing protein [Acidobacteriaceae bacterium]